MHMMHLAKAIMLKNQSNSHFTHLMCLVQAMPFKRSLSYAQLQVLLGFVYLNADLRSILSSLFYINYILVQS